MMDILTYAKLSLDVYSGKPTEWTSLLQRNQAPQNPTGLYRLKLQFPSLSPANPYYAQLYLQLNQGRATTGCIAFRGTDNWDNTEVDIYSWWKSVLLGNTAQDNLPCHHYLTESVAFYHQASRYVRKHHPELRQPLHVTGHSLGGALAALLPLVSRIPAKAITFNAPQIGTMPDVDMRNEGLLTGIEARYDFVSKIGKQIGKVYTVDVPNKEADAKAAFEASRQASQLLN